MKVQDIKSTQDGDSGPELFIIHNYFFIKYFSSTH
jgi:hypothetical protein